MKKMVAFLALSLMFTSLFCQSSYEKMVIRYCTSLGYQVLPGDNQKSPQVVLPDGRLLSIYSFYLGKDGKEYSYCAKKGFKIKSKAFKSQKDYRISYPICIGPDNSEIFLFSLMSKDKDYSDLFVAEQEPLPVDTLELPEPEPAPPVFFPPNTGDEYFDWSQLISMPPCKNQNTEVSCGSCYAFAATAIAEIEFFRKNGGSMPDFSEASLAFCGSKCYPEILGCGGLTIPHTPILMNMLCREGILYESSFVYDPYVNPCDETKWTESQTRVVFNSWGSINPDTSMLDPMSLIQALKTYGPLYLTIETESHYQWTNFPLFTQMVDRGPDSGNPLINDYVACSADPRDRMNHAVVLVGYGVDSHGIYFKIRNSFGSNQTEYNGCYRFITANSLRIPCYPKYYLQYIPRTVDQNQSSHLIQLTGAPITSQITYNVSNPMFYSPGSLTFSGSSFQVIPYLNQKGWDTATFTISYNTSCINPSHPTYAEQPYSISYWVGTPIKPEITGPNLLLPNASAVYSISQENEPLVSYYWITTGGITIESGQGTRMITVLANQIGVATIQVSKNNYYGTESSDIFPLNVNTNPMHEYPIIQCLTQDPCAYVREYCISNFSGSGASQTIWSSTFPSISITSSSNTNCRIEINNAGSLSATFHYIDGVEMMSSINIPFECPTLAVAPNPAMNEVTAVVTEPSNSVIEFEYRLLTSFGIQKKFKKSLKRHEVVEVTDLPNGTYSMVVKIKYMNGLEKTLSKTFVISH